MFNGCVIKGIATSLVLAALCLSVVCRFNAPTWDDEAQFLNWAATLRRTGSVVSTSTELNPAGREVRTHALWHPPLYLLVLSLLTPDPKQPTAARLLSVGCWAICLIISVGIIRCPSIDAQYSIGLVAIILCSLELAIPAIADGMLYLDIDTTVLAVAIMAFVGTFIATPQRSVTHNLVLISLFTSMMLWTKLTTPPFVVLGCCLVAVWHRHWRILGLTVAGCTLGTVLFLSSFIAYCHFTGVNIQLMLSMYTSKGGSALLTWLHSPGALVRSLYTNITWSSVWFLTLLAVMSFGGLMPAWKRPGPDDWKGNILLVTGSVIWLLYPFGFATVHPKYVYPGLILLATYTCDLMLHKHRTARVKEVTSHPNVIFPFFIVVVAIATRIPSLCFVRPWPSLRKFGISEMFAAPELRTLTFYFMIVSVACGAIVVARHYRRHSLGLEEVRIVTVVWATVLLFGYCDLAFALKKDDGFSPLNREYQSGFEATLGLVKTLRPGLRVLFSRPTSFYTNGTLINLCNGQDVFLREWRTEDIRNYGLKLLSERRLDLCVDSQTFPQALISREDCAKAGMTIIAFGDYYVATFDGLEKISRQK